ncbi:MAG TPA: protease modulator HflC [Verrucomicrobiota bacterium]|jgi:membrane protease subunit HflC|nr:protease modulator HflC [Verrucomicrobiota bacterium]HRT08230.1 protease modulator HflC [Candidatus Paceibacterota bacterium]HRT57928.1 protease modulator HflC [Candidatus Paceibacterota bacterium]
MKRNPLTLTIGILLILIVALLLFVFQVRQSEVVVITTFGKPTRQIKDPGAYLKWPWPIQSVHRFDQRVQNFEDKFSEGLTSDNFNLLSSVYVGWKITDARVFYPKFAASTTPIAEAEKVLERLLSNAKAAVIGKHPLSDFLSPADVGNRFTEIEDEILAAMRSELLANDYGIEIRFLRIKRLGLPETVTQSVFERMTSERQVLTSKSQFEGEAEAQKIRSEADRKAAEILAAADGQATQIRGKGEAEAAKSLEVFQQHPELANFIFRLNALEGALKDRSILIFDQQIPPFDLFRGSHTNLLSK